MGLFSSIILYGVQLQGGSLDACRVFFVQKRGIWIMKQLPLLDSCEGFFSQTLTPLSTFSRWYWPLIVSLETYKLSVLGTDFPIVMMVAIIAPSDIALLFPRQRCLVTSTSILQKWKSLKKESLKSTKRIPYKERKFWISELVYLRHRLVQLL